MESLTKPLQHFSLVVVASTHGIALAGDTEIMRKSVVSKKSHCDLQSIDMFERKSSQDKEAYITNFSHICSPRRASYDKTSQGRKMLFLNHLISFDDT